MKAPRRDLKIDPLAHAALRKLAAEVDLKLGQCADKLILAACVRYERTVKEIKALKKKEGGK